MASAPALWQRLAPSRTSGLVGAGFLALALSGLAREFGGGGLLLIAIPVVFVLVLLLSWRFARERDPGGDPGGELAERIEALLPQTQCAQCGYAGCKPYAQAIARGEAGIDQCPPGGDAGVLALAELLGRAPKPVNPLHGLHKPPQVALIREEECIGCTKCIQACPVDAIVGAPKLMHTVIAQLCTGCELCLPPCPVDCIDLVATTAAPRGIRAGAAG
jgi:electron transport complex protein RnfB